MTRPRPATVDAWRETLPRRFLLCRDLRHSWDPLDARKTGGVYELTRRCRRCGAERTIIRDLSGALVSHGSTHYPDGYLAPPGSGRITGDDLDALHLEAILRLIERPGR